MRCRQARKRLFAQASLTKEPPRWPRAREGRRRQLAGEPLWVRSGGSPGPRIARAPGRVSPPAPQRVPVAGKAMGVEGMGAWERVQEGCSYRKKY